MFFYLYLLDRERTNKLTYNPIYHPVFIGRGSATILHRYSCIGALRLSYFLCRPRGNLSSTHSLEMVSPFAVS